MPSPCRAERYRIPGVPSVANDVADDPARRLYTFQKRHALPVAVCLSPDRRPVHGVAATAEVDDVLRDDRKVTSVAGGNKGDSARYSARAVSGVVAR